ncbi:hypothetical protein BHU72_04345 [Desulfuribacillus stibiiarsenatis]|uniref:Response regulatory domain-containing protein n=1 Tax=Desulfuribacillus stibiiarsenatis TaxID=1390249 RepID=A0A1E5L592_9FIRM|nr:response regulator [Desulfuribacillus stibiiarsenatis]OEH85332.1 hypothetical protein BHU72_04345 [Desulfuribacillus stibiiarsenatis]
MKKIIILDPIKMARDRVRAITDKHQHLLLEAENVTRFFDLLTETRYDVDLVIVDVQVEENGFDVISKLKEKNPLVPVVVVTGETNRNAFIKGIRAGAEDYILKPYEDFVLEQRIVKILGTINQSLDTFAQSVQAVNLSLDQYLRGEIRKAQKANISLSIVLTTFFATQMDYNDKVEQKYRKRSLYLYEQLKKVFWETDIFLPYGSQTFIGIFPFCDPEHTHIVNDKIHAKYLEILEINEQYREFAVENSWVSFPEDGTTRENLLDTLIERATNAMRNRKHRSII